MRTQAWGKIEIDGKAQIAGPAILNEVHRLETQIRHLAHRVTGQRGSREKISASSVRSILRARQERSEHFDTDLFADPAWDILLELFALELENRRVSVSKLCLSAGVPATTALRWIEKLHEEGLVSKGEDPFDGRRIWVSLSLAGSKAMQGYFERRAMDALPV